VGSVTAASDLQSFYSTVGQVLPVLFIATVVEAAALWRVSGPLVSTEHEEPLLWAGSFALLLVTCVILLSEITSLRRLTGKTFLIQGGDRVIYAGLWAGGLALVLPVVLAQIAMAARGRPAAPRARWHVGLATAIVGLYLVAAVNDVFF
jgi:hypothetical protein